MRLLHTDGFWQQDEALSKLNPEAKVFVPSSTDDVEFNDSKWWFAADKRRRLSHQSVWCLYLLHSSVSPFFVLEWNAYELFKIILPSAQLDIQVSYVDCVCFFCMFKGYVLTFGLDLCIFLLIIFVWNCRFRSLSTSGFLLAVLWKL